VVYVTINRSLPPLLLQEFAMAGLVRIDPNAELVRDPDAPAESFVAPFAGDEPRFTGGIWGSDATDTTFDAYPFDEVVVILTGSIEITADGQTEVFGPGDSFGIAKGTPCRWIVAEGTRKVFAILSPEEE
jgi:uncharacterized cupin superfamily protein